MQNANTQTGMFVLWGEWALFDLRPKKRMQSKSLHWARCVRAVPCRPKSAPTAAPRSACAERRASAECAIS
eukprot:11180157-Alexandrium_andersonii.AAC.1